MCSLFFANILYTEIFLLFFYLVLCCCIVLLIIACNCFFCECKFYTRILFVRICIVNYILCLISCVIISLLFVLTCFEMYPVITKLLFISSLINLLYYFFSKCTLQFVTSYLFLFTFVYCSIIVVNCDLGSSHSVSFRNFLQRCF